ncbi:MAG: ATP-binding protein, partial [Natronomonas sp.]
NDMTVIRGYTQLLADTIEDESLGEIALNHIDNLLALSQKARELDRTIAFEFEYEETDVVSLVEGIVDTIEDRYPSATIRFDHDGPVTATVLPSLERAIRELVENAAKHSGQTPTIRISLEADPNTVEIRIADDGPGLDDNEVAVLETGTETPLAHGTGLGLWLTHWIVTSQDGHVDATVTDDGTTMTISVPRTPDMDVHQQVAQLQRTRDQYQAAFDEAVDAMVIVNDDARIIDANRRSTEIYGLERPKLLGREIPEFLPEGFDFEAEWREFQDSRGVRDTVTIVGGDGVKREVEYTARTDIVPGLHLIVSRETNGHVA